MLKDLLQLHFFFSQNIISTVINKGDENNGLLFTGDLAKRDKNGFFYIEGRKNRYIKIYGNRVNLDEIERLVRELVTYCACTGRDDKMTIFIEQGDKVMSVRKYVSSRTRLHISSIEVCHIEEIPKSSSGKTLYSELASK